MRCSSCSPAFHMIRQLKISGKITERKLSNWEAIWMTRGGEIMKSSATWRQLMERLTPKVALIKVFRELISILYTITSKITFEKRTIKIDVRSADANACGGSLRHRKKNQTVITNTKFWHFSFNCSIFMCPGPCIIIVNPVISGIGVCN